MANAGRNAPCPCGSGKKHKRCCGDDRTALTERVLPAGRFRFEPGSYGNSVLGFMPSILCYEQQGPDAWTEHFCLVKPDAVFADEDAATAMAVEHESAAHAARAAGGGPPAFALALKGHGYKNLTDFRVASEGA